MHGRRLLVIANNDENGTLGFIPELPKELYGVMTDPLFGNCDRVTSRLVINAARTDVEEAMADAMRQAANDRDHLLIYAIGHGVNSDRRHTYYYGQSAGEGVNIAEIIGRAFDDQAVPPGLALILDTCHSGQGAMDAAAVCTGFTQFAVVAAVSEAAAYDGMFTRRLLAHINNAENDIAGETLSLEIVADRIGEELSRQARPYYQHAKTGGRKVPYLARNGAFNGLGGRTLPAHYQEPAAVTAVVSALRDVSTVHVTGPFGSGKTTLAVALTKSYGPRGERSAGFLHATGFLTPNTTIGTLAASLSAQLAVSFGAFGASVEVMETQSQRALEAQNPLDTLVLQPLEAMKTQSSVRIVIDGYGEPSGCDEEQVRQFLRKLAGSPRVRLVVLGENGHTLPGAGARRLDLTRAEEEKLGAFLVSRGIGDEPVRRDILRLGNRNWSLTARLASIADDGSPTEPALETGIHEYFQILLERLEGGDWRWEGLLGPVLGVAALAGKGPVMPIEVLAAASAEAGGPGEREQVQRILGRLGELVERSDEGRATELAGLANGALADFLFQSAKGRFALDRVKYERALLRALEKEAPRNEMWMGRAATYAAKREAEHMANLEDPGLLDSLRLRESRNVLENLDRWKYWKERLERSDGDRSASCLFAEFQVQRCELEILNRNPRAEPEKAAKQKGHLKRMEAIYGELSKRHGKTRARFHAGADWCEVLAGSRSTSEAKEACEKLAEEARKALAADDVVLLEIEGMVMERRAERRGASAPAQLVAELDRLLARVREATSERSRYYLGLSNIRAAMVGKDDPDEAVAILQEVLKRQRAMTGDDDSAVLDTRHNIVAFRRKSKQEGQLEKAFAEIGPLVYDQERYFGARHFHTIQTRLLDARLGFLHGFREDAASVRLIETLLADARTALEDGHEFITRIGAWEVAMKRRLGGGEMADTTLIATIDALREAGIDDPKLEELLRPAGAAGVKARGAGGS